MTARHQVIAGGAIVLMAIAAALVLLLSAAGEDDGERYRVQISFNETVVDADMAEAAALLREYDRDVDMAILESFPPQGSAIVQTEDTRFCDKIIPALESESYVEAATCTMFEPSGDDGDEPVSNPAE